MGAFLFSTRDFDKAKVVAVLKSRGHKSIDVESLADVGTLIHTPKILVDNVNYLSAKDLDALNAGDYICGVGTYFYKDKYGEDALKQVFCDLDVVLEKNPVYGHWAFVVRKGDTTYIFNDMSGSLRLYYFVGGGQGNCLIFSNFNTCKHPAS